MASTALPNNQLWKAFSGASYASARPTYPKALYEVLVDYHRRTGGQMDIAVDLGCGPVSRSLLSYTLLDTSKD
jgi:hypothetical protein